MKIKFQENIDKELMIDIVKLFHPSLDVEVIKKNIKFKPHGNYNWVMIMFSVKDYGYISLGICNHESTKCLFGPISKEYVSKLFKDKCITYKIWRFVDDIHSKNESYIQQDSSEFIRRIPLPSEEEFYSYYMRD